MPRVHLPDGRIVNFPDGMSEQDISKAIGEIDATVTQKPSTPQQTQNPYTFAARKIMGVVKDHPIASLSALGGAAGVAATAPVSIPAMIAASALGGAGGAGIGMMRGAAYGSKEQTPATARGVVGEMGKQGAIQGVAEGIGSGVIAPVASRMARVLMDNAVRPTETLLREFPNVIETLIKERIPVGRIFGKTGSQQAKGALRESAATTRGLLGEADAAGATVAPQQMMSELPALRAEAQKSAGLPGGGAGKLPDMEAEFAATHSASIPASEAKDLKRSAQALAKPVYKAQRMGHVVGPEQSQGAAFNEAVARGTKQGIEDIPEFGPRIAASEKRTQDLIGATQAVRKAEARRLPLWAELASTGAGTAAGAVTGDYKTGLGTGLALRAITSPRSLSRGALALDSLGPMSPQMLRMSALIAALGGEEQ